MVPIINLVKLEIPEGLNIILGQSHFIKTVEDIYELITTTVPHAQFGIAFTEASSKCLIRSDGNNKKLIKLAEANIKKLGAGHSFLIYLKDCYPINILPRLKQVQEIVNIFCATANPVEVIVAKGTTTNAILGVADGAGPKGIEGENEKVERKEFLRKIAYKR